MINRKQPRQHHNFLMMFMLPLSLQLTLLAATTCHGFSFGALNNNIKTPLTNKLTNNALFGAVGQESTVGYKVRALENCNEILQAQNLLYVVYVEEQGYLTAPG